MSYTEDDVVQHALPARPWMEAVHSYLEGAEENPNLSSFQAGRYKTKSAWNTENQNDLLAHNEQTEKPFFLMVLCLGGRFEQDCPNSGSGERRLPISSIENKFVKLCKTDR